MASIPRFLLPRGPPRTLYGLRTTQRYLSSSPSLSKNTNANRTLSQPDKFRPPSHPSRRVVQTRKGKVEEPMQYGPRLTEKEKEEQDRRQYPRMFPPEGTVMYRFLTTRWIHVWIALSILTTLATFTFTTNFKATSPFAHLLPPWSGLLTSPIATISQALSVYRMHVQHVSVQTREKRQRRVEDAEKRRQYRIAHGMEEERKDESKEKKEGEADDQSPIAKDAKEEEFVDFEGRRRPVKKWLGIW